MEYMKTKVVLNVFEAGEGDFFWLKYKAEENWQHILIDSGGVAAFRDYKHVLRHIRSQNEIVEAIVFTHIDGDHIGGGMKAFSGMCKEELPVIKRILMNSATNVNICVPQSVQLTAGQAIKLERVFTDMGLGDKMVYPILQGDLIQLSGGAEIKVISPNRESLLQFDTMLGKNVEDEFKSPQLGRKDEQLHTHNISDYVSEKDMDDKRPENMAGIAFVFELDGIKIAFLADANAHVCAEGLGLFYEQGTSFDLVKLSHHGSQKNTTRELTETINAHNFLLSTNGHGGKPSKQMLCRLLETYGHVDLICNYAWWEQHYSGLYFTEKDNKEFVGNGRLNIVSLKEEEMNLSKGMAIRLRRKNREIEG